jgi:membrane-bound serine protease (ClpP class)
MSLIVALVLSTIFLEWPWRLLAIVPAALLEGAEIYLWLRLRRVPSITGVEALLDAEGEALTGCRPEGQVRVKGQVWKATCPGHVAAGDRVIVTAVHGLTLEVAPWSAAPTSSLGATTEGR